MSFLSTIEPSKTEIEYGKSLRREVIKPAEPLILSGQEAEHRFVTHLALLSDYLRLEAATSLKGKSNRLSTASSTCSTTFAAR